MNVIRSSGFVQIGPMTNDEGNNADSFLIRMGQTAGFGYAPNERWPNAFMVCVGTDIFK